MSGSASSPVMITPERAVSRIFLARKLVAMGQKHDARFKVVFDSIRGLMAPPEPRRKGAVVPSLRTPAGARLSCKEEAR